MSHLDRQAMRTTHVGRGRLSAAEIRAVTVATYRSGAFEAGMDILWDLRNADLSSIDFAAVRDVAELVRHFWTSNSGRTAVVTATPSDYGVVRQFGGLVADLPRAFDVFETIEEAEAWLIFRAA